MECAQVLIEELGMVVRLVIFIFMAIKLILEKEKGSLSFIPCPIMLSVLATENTCMLEQPGNRTAFNLFLD